MNRQEADIIAQGIVPEDEPILAMFVGSSRISLGWVFFIGLLVFLSMREHLVILTDKHIYINRVDPFSGDIEAQDAFSYDEFNITKMKSSFRTYIIHFSFLSGRTLKIRTDASALKPTEESLALLRSDEVA